MLSRKPYRSIFLTLNLKRCKAMRDHIAGGSEGSGHHYGLYCTHSWTYLLQYTGPFAEALLYSTSACEMQSGSIEHFLQGTVYARWTPTQYLYFAPYL